MRLHGLYASPRTLQPFPAHLSVPHKIENGLKNLLMKHRVMLQIVAEKENIVARKKRQPHTLFQRPPFVHGPHLKIVADHNAVPAEFPAKQSMPP